MTDGRSAASSVAHVKDKQPDALAQFAAERFRGSRQSWEIDSASQKSRVTRSTFSFPNAIFLLPPRIAAADTQARVIFDAPAARSLRYCDAAKAASKAAARRPHRCNRLLASNPTVPPASRGDVPFRSYSGMNTARGAALRFVVKWDRCGRKEI
jgi:hypothetical protein